MMSAASVYSRLISGSAAGAASKTASKMMLRSIELTAHSSSSQLTTLPPRSSSSRRCEGQLTESESLPDFPKSVDTYTQRKIHHFIIRNDLQMALARVPSWGVFVLYLIGARSSLERSLVAREL